MDDITAITQGWMTVPPCPSDGEVGRLTKRLRIRLSELNLEAHEVPQRLDQVGRFLLRRVSREGLADGGLMNVLIDSALEDVRYSFISATWTRKQQPYSTQEASRLKDLIQQRLLAPDRKWCLNRETFDHIGRHALSNSPPDEKFRKPRSIVRSMTCVP